MTIILRDFLGIFYNFQPKIDLAGEELIINPEESFLASNTIHKG